jgi:uncharacterized OB-fold protein
VRTAAATPVHQGLFVWPAPDGQARLIVSRCPRCNDVSFPAVARCRMPQCSLVATEPAQLSGSGNIIAWTVQRYPPPGPFGRVDSFHPITIALVEFAEHRIAVLGQVWNTTSEAVVAGCSARLTLGTLYSDDDAVDVVGWGFVLQDAAAP